MNNDEFLDKYQEFYNYLIKMLSIAKIGLVYSKDEYALSNYEQVEDLTMKTLENFEHLKFDRQNYFQRNIYPTPNISIRVAIFNKQGEILLVREVIDHGYSLPGGWCDLYDSPKEAIENECMQEAGVRVKNIRFLGLFNRTPFKQIIGAQERRTVPEYLLLVRADLASKFSEHEYETDDVKFFNANELPKMSSKISLEEWNKLIKCAINNEMIIE